MNNLVYINIYWSRDIAQFVFGSVNRTAKLAKECVIPYDDDYQYRGTAVYTRTEIRAIDRDYS